jgi:hypothetical protein
MLFLSDVTSSQYVLPETNNGSSLEFRVISAPVLPADVPNVVSVDAFKVKDSMTAPGAPLLSEVRATVSGLDTLLEHALGEKQLSASSYCETIPLETSLNPAAWYTSSPAPSFPT